MKLSLDTTSDRTFVKVLKLDNEIFKMTDQYDYTLEVVTGSGGIRFNDNAISVKKSGYLGFSIKNSELEKLGNAFIDYRLVATQGSEVIKSGVSEIGNIQIDEIP